MAANEVGHLFQTAPDVIKAVLSCLTYRQLKRMALVCKSWRDYGDRILAVRSQFKQFIVANRKNPDQLDAFKTFVNSLYINVDLVFVFRRLTRFSRVNRDFNSTTLCSLLPPKCTIIGANCTAGVTDIISNDQTSELCRRLWEQPAIPGFNTLFDTLFLPNRQNSSCRIRPFSMTKKECVCLETTAVNRAKLMKALDWPSEEPVKSLLLLSNEGKTADVLGRRIREFEQGTVSLVGGIVDDVDIAEQGGQDVRQKSMVGLIFGGSLIATVSIMLRDEDENDGKIKSRLLHLRKQMTDWTMPVRRRLAFLFTCCNRSRNTDVEIFRRIFPGVSICGMKVNGEFGYQLPEELNGQKKRRKSDQHEKIVWEGTTTINIIGFY